VCDCSKFIEGLGPIENLFFLNDDKKFKVFPDFKRKIKRKKEKERPTISSVRWIISVF